MRWKIKYGVLTAVVCVDLSNEADTIWCCRNFLGFGTIMLFILKCKIRWSFLPN